MPTPEEHALLSASSAARWLKCTAAPRFEQQFPESTTEYAEEGRLAHAFCELKVLSKFTNQITPRTFTTRLNKLRKDPLYTAEMERASDLYIDNLTEQATAYDAPPSVAAEVRVDFAEVVPEGFGTCDCVMVGGDMLSITDFKYGKGVLVSAKDNPQMRLYALGALKRYKPIYGDTISRVRMTIVQPRIDAEFPSSSETITVEELQAWGESVAPTAKIAFSGFGKFCPGEHCRFCRGKAQCKARAEEEALVLTDYVGSVPEALAGPGSNISPDEEVGRLLELGKSLVAWYKDLEEYAFNAIMDGKPIPGWKVVAGRSVRSFTDQEAAFKAVVDMGYNEALLYERKPKSLTEIEKLVGKKVFNDTLADFISKPQGKPTLVPESDKREPYSSAAADFGGV